MYLYTMAKGFAVPIVLPCLAFFFFPYAFFQYTYMFSSAIKMFPDILTIPILIAVLNLD